ncbi:CBL-interacting protein kinase 25 [Stylophora pistillata]|uniref:CBL-interacting protein kinase 25 n=1 Tax=Stylophora pistillata TaxID=50429 RepID=A0A2B4REX1_STYPI|nr:CBL-interacting protein kinase 25 [Stylophora pistillata]
MSRLSGAKGVRVYTASEIRGRLAIFGLQKGLAAGVIGEKLDLKGQSDLLGQGAFSSVYQGIVKTENGDKRTVALKIYTNSLGAENACDIVNEIGLLHIFFALGLLGHCRKQKHPNVVNFHGTSLLKDDGEIRVILDMEYCTGNLKDRIFKNPEGAPANSKNADAKRDSCRWMKQITAALTFIYEQKVVHRDLKLDDILI